MYRESPSLAGFTGLISRCGNCLRFFKDERIDSLVFVFTNPFQSANSFKVAFIGIGQSTHHLTIVLLEFFSLVGIFFVFSIVIRTRILDLLN